MIRILFVTYHILLNLLIEYGKICIKKFERENIQKKPYIGIVRELDDLRRVVIPAEYLRVLEIEIGDIIQLRLEDKVIKVQRLRALLIFMGLFNAIITITTTYKGNMLTELDVKPETFSIINAVLTFISGIAATFQNKIHEKFRNKSLTVLSISYILSFIAMGLLLYLQTNNVLPLILILLAFIKIPMANYYILSERYSKNFSTPKTRLRISFAIEFSTNIIEAISLFLAGTLLDSTNIMFATLFVGLVFLILFVLVLDYMRTRVGLKPEEYDKKDIELE